MSHATLPVAFADLEPWAQRFGLPTEAARNHARVTADYGDLKRFYEVALPRMEAVMDFLATVPNTDDAPAEARRLADLGAAFMDTSISVELFKSPTVPEGFDWRRFEILM